MEPKTTCSKCGKPAQRWEPISGGPVTDALCFKHRWGANLRSPGMLSALVVFGVLGLLLWGVVSAARWAFAQ